MSRFRFLGRTIDSWAIYILMFYIIYYNWHWAKESFWHGMALAVVCAILIPRDLKMFERK